MYFDVIFPMQLSEFIKSVNFVSNLRKTEEKKGKDSWIKYYRSVDIDASQPGKEKAQGNLGALGSAPSGWDSKSGGSILAPWGPKQWVGA